MKIVGDYLIFYQVCNRPTMEEAYICYDGPSYNLKEYIFGVLGVNSYLSNQFELTGLTKVNEDESI
jgi:hypothetical protein